jgi:hypothetical protein
MKCHACKKDKDDFEIVNDKRRLTCNECKNKRLLNKCDHGQAKSKCRVCPNSKGVCEHNTRRDICRICVGSQLCICLKQKFGCFRCNPADALFKRAGNRIRGVLGDYMRGKRTEDILGCNKYEYFEYIQNKFVGDMSFERFMIDLEIDHIKAIGYRENNIYPSIEDKIRRLHFMNTRPLYREENRRKGWRNLTI